MLACLQPKATRHLSPTNPVRQEDVHIKKPGKAMNLARPGRCYILIQTPDYCPGWFAAIQVPQAPLDWTYMPLPQTAESLLMPG